mgnify:CR=1 FL=1
MTRLADNWSATSPAGAPLNRSYHSAVWVGGVMVVWGGHSYRGPFQTYPESRHRRPIRPSVTDTWAATTTAGAPSARYLQAAVQIGNVMAVWGGFGGVDARYGRSLQPLDG